MEYYISNASKLLAMNGYMNYIISYLLDTHTFLWALRGSPNLSAAAGKVTEDMNVQIFVSAVSAYEIMNKHRIDKLQKFDDITKDFFAFVKKLGVDSLPVVENPCPASGRTMRQETKEFINGMTAKNRLFAQTVFGAIKRSGIKGWKE